MLMDKGRFIETAPEYYAFAIAKSLKNEQKTAAAIREGDGLYNQVLFDAAIDWLWARGLIEITEDEFGPTLYGLSQPDWEAFYQTGRARKGSLYQKYVAASDSFAWLTSALQKINETYSELGIQRSDFENPDAEWEPIPLERPDANLDRVIRSIDDTIERVRTDNGYNATVPEERNLILDSLSAASTNLKTAASTSLPYLRTFVFRPLMVLIRRFKDAALGVLASSAKDTVIEFLKQHGIKFLDQMFK
jgi:hypothetical protein